MKEILVEGKKFKCFSEACNYYNINETTVRFRISKGYEIDRAFTQPVLKQKRSIEIGNQKFESIGVAAKKFGIDRDTISARLCSGWSINEALTTPVERASQPHKIPVKIGKEKYESIKEAATAYSINPETVYSRINMLGWNIKDAITTEVRVINRKQ